MLGLNEPWIERWEENGALREESCAPDQLPEFLKNKLKKGEVENLEHRVDQLVAAGCRKPVVYFCLQQLSPTSEWIRSGGHHVGTPSRPGEDCTIKRQKTPVATREDMSSLVANARATRNQIRRFTSSLSLMAKASGIALPACLSISMGNVDDALDLLENSLTWVAKIAEAYTAPMAETLLKSKGLLYLAAYVSRHCDQRKLRSPRVKNVMKGPKRASGDLRARRSVEAPGNVLAELATQAAGKSWSTAELKGKLESFRQKEPRLYRLLDQKLTELHRFAGR
jgi:hypothetical protein